MATGSVTVQNLYADILNQGSAGTGIAVNHNLVFPNGTGLDFNATQSTATGVTPSSSAVLDDYEEGTWTPTLENFTKTGTSTATGKYTKIGRIVYFSLTVSTTGTIAGTANSSNISGLPFQVISSIPAVQSGVGNFGDSFKGFCVTYVDESIYTESFPAQDDTILINGFYETS